MKKYFLWAAMIACLTSCSKQEDLRSVQHESVEDLVIQNELNLAKHGLAIEVVRAPVVPDGTSAHAITDIVLNFRNLDPAIDGISIKKDGYLEVILPPEFTNTGNGPNTGIVLQGWPQSPPGPPPLAFGTSVVQNTIKVTMLKDFKVGTYGPGPKQIHLALFGFRNPGAGLYSIPLCIKPDPNNGETKCGVGSVHIIPKPRPAVSAVSLFSGGGPPPPFNNAIYQEVDLGEMGHTVGLYLWESRGKPLVGADIQMENNLHGRIVKSNGSTAGHLWISAPRGATDFTLATEGPSEAGKTFLTNVDVGILKTKFTPDPNTKGEYRLSFKMNNGNTQNLFVCAE